MDINKWFEEQKIEPVQDRKDGMDYWKNYELFTYNDLMECMEALLILPVVVGQGEQFICQRDGIYGEKRCDKQCEGCSHL